MPLAQPVLESSLRSLFSQPPNTVQACAQSWADALEAYFLPVFPVSTTVSAAAEALVPSLVQTFTTSTTAFTTAAQMEASFLTFATTVATGMAPGYTGLPPTAQVGFLSLFSVVRETTDQAVAAFTQAIVTWSLTGTATLVAPPFTVTNWV